MPFKNINQRDLRSTDQGRNTLARKCRIRKETPARAENVSMSVLGYLNESFFHPNSQINRAQLDEISLPVKLILK